MSLAGDARSTGPQDASVDQCVAAAALEVQRIATLGRQLQDRLGPALILAGDLAFEAQGLDDLVQQADGLAAFLDILGRQCEQTWRVWPERCAANLGLAAQRVRLTGGQAPPPVDPGDLEMF